MTNKSRTLYTGVTGNLERRVGEHKQGKGSVFTSRYKINQLVYFESCSDVLDAIAKHIQLEQSFDAILAARRHGLRVDCSFILGHHTDTLKTIEKTIMFAQVVRDSKIGTAVIGISTPFPGTRLFEDADILGIVLSTHNWHKYDLVHPTYHTSNFTENDLKRAQYFFEYESLHGKQSLELTNSDHREFRSTLKRLVDSLKLLDGTPT